jgi:hypothetical protein
MGLRYGPTGVGEQGISAAGSPGVGRAVGENEIVFKTGLDWPTT